MPGFVGRCRCFAALAAFSVLLGAPLRLAAQVAGEAAFTGDAAKAWQSWQKATKALLARDAAAAEGAFGELVSQNVSALRIALLADRTLTRTSDGGALVLLEQDAESGALQENGKKVYALYETGREQLNQADDAIYFSLVGQFPIAQANFQALLAGNPDPVALLEFIDRDKKRQETLVLVADNPVVGESARALLKLLDGGERLIKGDPLRISEHIARLGGPPRQFENAVARLKEAGEYSIPFLVQALRDPKQRELLPAVLRTIPQIDRAGLNPLVQSLRMKDQATLKYIIDALGTIGYSQSVPYLLKLRDASGTAPEVRSAVDAALGSLSGRGVTISSGAGAAQAFYDLAVQYYADAESLRADTRLDTANVWYWRDEMLQNIEVPTAIFNEIMCMRCCEEALLLNADLKPALALWVAANLRREAQLPSGTIDATRPDNDPPAAYYAQSAGPEYCLMALARAIDDKESSVALGAIEALRRTAGAASVLPDAGGRMPLIEALSFGDRMVRVRAAIALAGAVPTKSFAGDHNVMTVLGEALQLNAGTRNALVIDADEASANSIASTARAQGYEASVDAALLSGLEKARKEMPGLDVIFMASDIANPGLDEAISMLRSEARFSTMPVLIIAKPGAITQVKDKVRRDSKLGMVTPESSIESVTREIMRVSQAAGSTALTPEQGLAIALEAAEVLLDLARARSPLFRPEGIEQALAVALGGQQAELRVAAARALAFVPSRSAQTAVAKVALADSELESLRVMMFDALAASGKNCGNLLDGAELQKLIETVEKDASLTIRTAASQALGALNVPGNPASAIVRAQHGG